MEKPSLIIALKTKAKNDMDNMFPGKGGEHGDSEGGYDQDLHDELMEKVQEVCSAEGLEQIRAINDLQGVLEHQEEVAAESIEKGGDDEDEEDSDADEGDDDNEDSE